MSVPSNPTVTVVVTEALKRAGRTTPTATMVADAITHQFQEVKADLRMAAPCHESLKTEAYTTLVRGLREYDWPAEAHKIEYVQVVDGSIDAGWVDTAQAGTTSSITLASTFSLTEDEMIGRRVFLVEGPGEGQRGFVIAWDNGTKIATFAAPVTVAITSATTYLVERQTWCVWGDPSWAASQSILPYSPLGPYRSTMRGRKIVLSSAPPRTCVLVWSYWASLDQLDEVGTVFVRHLREFRSLWLQGVDVKTCQRYDEDRYLTEAKLYDAMLTAYGGTACNVLQGTFTD